jgi:hypothetical protein
LDTIEWLEPVDAFIDNTVYRVSGAYEHIWADTGDIEWYYQSPVEYFIAGIVSGSTITFSEQYDPGWVAYVGDKEISSLSTDDNLNSFTIETISKGERIRLYYKPQEYANVGMRISGVTAFCVILTLVYLWKKR